MANRSDWVAVEPQFQAPSDGTAGQVKPAKSAFMFFLSDAADIRQEIKEGGITDIGDIQRELSSRVCVDKL